MENVGLIIEELSAILLQPKMALFVAISIFAYLLKNYSPLKNELIPWFCTLAGAGLSLVLVELSAAGAIFGAAIGLFLVAGHQVFTNTYKVFDN